MLDRQERRSHELAAFKEKTRAILETFDVKVGDVQLEETTNWLNNYIVNVVIENIGVAFPLIHDDLIRQSSSSSVRAFLFSIHSITFSTTRGETGEALLQRLCFQFVPRFAPEILVLIHLSFHLLGSTRSSLKISPPGSITPGINSSIQK